MLLESFGTVRRPRQRYRGRKSAAMTNLVRLNDLSEQQLALAMYAACYLRDHKYLLHQAEILIIRISGFRSYCDMIGYCSTLVYNKIKYYYRNFLDRLFSS